MQVAKRLFLVQAPDQRIPLQVVVGNGRHEMSGVEIVPIWSADAGGPPGTFSVMR